MSNAKPYLFGAVLGASAMYVALQYHVVHSHDGFQMVPRTPQHSVGLAYADVRSWTPSQWTDRPELARALMAHGSSDLISESVATSLADTVADENSTLDQLRSFLNKPAQNLSVGSAGGLLQIPNDPRQTSNALAPLDDLLPIPMPPETKHATLADPFQVAQGTAGPVGPTLNSTPPGASRFSAADLRDDLRNNADSPADSFSYAPQQATSGSISRGTTATGAATTAQQAKLMEDRIFGNSPASGLPARPADIDASQSMFEEVSSQLESRARAAINRAQSSVVEKATTANGNDPAAASNFVRQRLEQVTPEAAKSAIPNSAVNKSTSPESSLLDQFDPFLE